MRSKEKNIDNSKKENKVQTGKRRVPGIWSNLRRSFRIVRENKIAILGAVAIYAMLYFSFVRVITEIDLDSLKETITGAYDGEEGSRAKLALAGSLFLESFDLGQAGSAQFLIIYLINALALVWILRYIWARKKPVLKEAYYQGMYPLVPVLIILLIMFLQAIPFSVAAIFLQTALSNDIAISTLERVGTIAVFVVATVISFYWLAGSAIAFYAVTVPGLEPLVALRRAKELLEGRRVFVMMQMFLFMVMTFILGALILIAVAFLWDDAIKIATASVIILSLPWVHMYGYGLYRDMLNE